ncbi:MAG: hypothetical protein SGPRY_013397 [Prymnesium sp.]
MMNPSRGSRLINQLTLSTSSSEYRLEGHIEGSINIPAYSWEHGFYLPSPSFSEQVAQACPVHAPLVLLCADGSISRPAAAMLSSQSFDVKFLEGGLAAWEEAAEQGEEVPPLMWDEDGEGGLTGAWI